MTNTFDRFNSWKVLAYSEKLRQITNGMLPLPVNWHVYPSNFCPCDCNFCIMKVEKQKRVMLEPAVLKKMVADAIRLGVKLVHFSGGGEPLTHPDLSTAIQTLRTHGVKVALSTNGVMLERLNAQVDHLRVSFDVGSKEGYEKIKGVDAYDVVIGNIKDAVRKNKALDIGMGYVVTPDNYAEVDSFIKIAEDCNVEFVHIRPAYWPERNNEIREVMPKINVSSNRVKVFVSSEKFKGLWDFHKHPCRATPLFAVLAATGEFLLCQDRSDLRFGDYANQTFEEIWFSQKHRDLMEKALSCGIRCVEAPANEIIQRVFIDNEVRLELL